MKAVAAEQPTRYRRREPATVRRVRCSPRRCGQNPRLSSTGREWRRRACATAVAKPTWWRRVETGTPVGFWENTEFFRLYVLEFEKDWGREASGATQAVAGRVFGRRDAWPGSTRAPDFRMDFRRTCR